MITENTWNKEQECCLKVILGFLHQLNILSDLYYVCKAVFFYAKKSH